MSLIFIGIGLTAKGLTIEGLNEAQRADHVFIDMYTSLIPHDDIRTLQNLIGKDIKPLHRSDVEGRGAHELLKLSERGTVALLVIGDPFIATTHIALRLEAIKRGIKVKYIPSASIISVVPGLTGLSSYKFGRPATIVFPDKGPNNVAYDAIKDNLSRGLHTLLYLDLEVESQRAMTINEALRLLLDVEAQRAEGVVREDMLIVGVARACWSNGIVKAAKLSKLIDYDFGPPPHVLVVPGPLHFIEYEALKALASMED
ncbi:MAG: diphthine synthase [Candidatus Nezhaarchaeota archaeon]|nr:diphthine synthase [Candidatus Nezhaarchaeota archaeon]